MNPMVEIIVNKFLLTISILLIVLAAVALGRAVAGDVVEFSPEQSEVLASLKADAYMRGMTAAIDSMEEACAEDGKFVVQVGAAVRSYRCQPDWI